jgi:hypothetical protein
VSEDIRYRMSCSLKILGVSHCADFSHILFPGVAMSEALK